MALGRTVRALREAQGLTQGALSERTGGVVSQAAISAMEARDSAASKFAPLLAEALGVTVDTLMGLESSNVIPFDSQEDAAPDSVVLVHEYSLRLSGGPGSTPILDEITESRAVPFMRDYLREMGIPPSAAKRFKVHGWSMAPTVGHGDMVLVDTSDRDIRNGMVYAICYGEDLRIKRLFRKRDGSLILHSDNPETRPREEEIPAEEIDDQIVVIGRVRDRSGASGLDAPSMTF